MDSETNTFAFWSIGNGRMSKMLKHEVVKVFLISRLLVLGMAYGVFYFSMFYNPLPPAPPNYVSTGQGDLNWRPLNVLYYYDAVHYMDIAENGYGKWRLTCWFPLYPLLIRTFGGTVASAVIVSNLSLLAALFAIHRLGGKKALWLAAFSPISIVFSSAYSESLFLALTAWSMVMVEQKKPVICGIIGGLAALARPTGWVAVAGLGVYLVLKREPKAAAKVVLLGSAIGLLYPVYLFVQFGDPLLFAKANAYVFGREPCLPFSGLLTDLEYLFREHNLRSFLIPLNFVGFLLLFGGALTKWWPYTLIYSLMVLCSGVANQKVWLEYLPYIFGLLRYAGACVPVYLNEKTSIFPWVVLSVVISILVALKWFIF